MKRRSLRTPAVFFASALATAAGLGWITSVLLEFEGERRESRAAERLHGDLRLAAWRVDSMLAPLLSEEAARPASHFKAFSPLNRSMDSRGASNAAGNVLVPSPIMKSAGKWVSFNFELDARGALASPQVPKGVHAKWAGEFGLSPVSVAENTSRLGAFSSSIDAAGIRGMLDEALSAPGGSEAAAAQAGGGFARSDSAVARDQSQGIEDYNARSRALDRMATQQNTSNTRIWDQGERVSRLVPLWIAGGPGRDPLLVLVRRVESGCDRLVQGAVLDWPAIRTAAEDEIRDLFPSARLVPKPADRPADPNRALAVLPLEIDPGPVEGQEEPLVTPLRIGIAALWTAFAVGSAALLLGISGLLALNRRRLDFVSAVTHELRTPLTTFRMYAEMLDDGMVPPEKIPEYYATLRDESLRLSHLVQNVLDYSRLESDRPPARVESAPMEFHLGRIVPPLKDRCARAGRGFSLDDGGLEAFQAAMDSSAAGQILLNLVDNACKYGEGEVSLSVRISGRLAEFTISDRGTSIPPADRKRMFEPFTRGSSSEGKGPGVGLGLTLCRRWARAMGGDLEYRPGPPHAFMLKLPV